LKSGDSEEMTVKTVVNGGCGSETLCADTDKRDKSKGKWRNGAVM